MASLGTLGRKHYVSQSALSAILAEVKAMEEALPTNVGRKALKRARQEQCDISTPVGDMFVTVKLEPRDSKGVAIDLKVLNPVAWLYHISTLDGFGEFFEKEVMAAVPSASAPWETWFTLGCIRSHLVEKVQDGLSGVMASILRAFYAEPHDLRRGVLFRLHSGRRVMFFAKATLLVADESALKIMLAIKGASGTVPCV